MNLSYLSDNINYISPNNQLYIYDDNNCIIDGGILTGSILNNNLIRIIISPIELLFNHTYMIIDNDISLEFDLTNYDQSGLILIIAHYSICNELGNSNLFYRLAYLSENSNILQPEICFPNDYNKIDLIDRDYSIILGSFKFQKNKNNQVINLKQNLLDLNNIDGYVFKNYCYLGQNKKKFEIRPFDLITNNISSLIKNKTGETGGTGYTGGTGESGEKGLTGGTGNTGGTGTLTRTLPLKQYIHYQKNKNSIWLVNHNLNQKYVNIQVYNNLNKQIQPNEIELIDNNNLKIDFNNNLVSGNCIITCGPDLNETADDYFILNNHIYEDIDSYEFKTGGTGGIGNTGLKGFDGNTGLQGIPGLPGFPGRDGRNGCRGYKGRQGKQGDIGPTGPIGCVGNIGSFGIRGEQGGTGGTGGTGTKLTLDETLSLVPQLTQLLSKLYEIPKLLYPIGSVYITLADDLPNLLKEYGTWVLIEDRFIYSTKDIVDIVAGEKTHQLTYQEMPRHVHELNVSKTGKHSHEIKLSSFNETHTHTLISCDYNTHGHEAYSLEKNGAHKHKVRGVGIGGDYDTSGPQTTAIHIGWKCDDKLIMYGGEHDHKINVFPGGKHRHECELQPDKHFHEIIIDENSKSIIHTHDVIENTSFGKLENEDHENMPPYLTVHIWRRIL